MEYIIDNWYVIIGLIALLCVIILFIAKFLGLPTKTQIAKIKAWLLQAVVEAEKELGSGTGRIKLSAVYDKFISKFPMTAKFISFETFSNYVDLALDEMKVLLETNQNVKELVDGKE